MNSRPPNLEEFPIFCGEQSSLLPTIEDRIAHGRSCHIVTLNPEIFQLARRSAAFATVLDSADLVTADGVGILWALAARGQSSAARITGVSLVQMFLAEPTILDLPIVVVGSSDEARTKFEDAARLARAPVIKGLSPTLGQEGEGSEILTNLLPKRAIFLVALGAPKQDFVIRGLMSTGHTGVFVGVGGAIDILGSPERDVLLTAEKHGLHWLYRLLRHPADRFRRQASALPHFTIREIALPFLRRILSSTNGRR